MTKHYEASDAHKAMEENPEQYEQTPDVDEDAEPMNRHNGSVTTDLGGESVSNLISKV